MFVILGGAYNGKRKFVEQLIASKGDMELVEWSGKLPSEFVPTTNKRYIISDFEKIISNFLALPELQAAEIITKLLFQLAKDNEVYCICTDMSRGVVPLERQDRQLRDISGRVYQKLCAEASDVIRVWYGIPQWIKGEQHG